MAIQYIVNVEAFISDGERYLMLIRSEQEEHAPGTLSVPGGKVEDSAPQGDILEQTVRREILEEVGIEVEKEMRYVESKLFAVASGVLVIDIVFLCRYRSGTPRITDPAEVGAIAWMRPEEILAHPKTPPWTRASLERVLALETQNG